MVNISYISEKLVSTGTEDKPDDFFDIYANYVTDTESTYTYHRWCAISAIGAMLGRNYFFQHGHFTVYPNMYIMLLGKAGDRKSSAIKIAKKLVRTTGYAFIAPDKTSKEKFLLDLNDQVEIEASDVLDTNLWGDMATNMATKPPVESYIAADEFNDFIGNGNIDFISLLGSFWDYDDVYQNKIKNGKSVCVPYPTISILGGNTPTGFALAFPTQVLEQGFFSRLLLIYGEPTGRKITFPEPPCPLQRDALVLYLQRIRREVVGPAKVTKEASLLLDKLYKTWEGMEDVRFDSYANRRFTHLLKLCLIHSAARLSTTITANDVIYANTVLTHTEHLMPKALGEFGKSRHSDIVHKIMMILDKSNVPIPPKDIITAIHSDIDNINVAVELIKGLQAAGKIIQVSSVGNMQGGYMVKRRIRREQDSDTFDITLLTEEERNY